MNSKAGILVKNSFGLSYVNSDCSKNRKEFNCAWANVERNPFGCFYIKNAVPKDCTLDNILDKPVYATVSSPTYLLLETSLPSSLMKAINA